MNPRISISIDQNALERVVALPLVAAAAERAGITRFGTFNLSDTGVSFKLTSKGQRAKVKVSIAARSGNIVLDIRDVRISGLSIGGDWVNGVVANIMKQPPAGLTVAKQDGALWIGVPGIRFRAVGVEGDKLHIIFDLDGEL